MDKFIDREYIFGKNPVIEVLNAKRRKVYEIFTTEKKYNEFKSFFNQHRKILKILEKEKLTNLVKRSDHQGFVALTDSYEYSDFYNMIKIEKGYLLILENITDPQNLGAIIRSSVQLGCSGIIIPSTNSSAITSIVTHTSAGATEYISITQEPSLLHSIKELIKNNFFIYSTNLRTNDCNNLNEIDINEKSVIIMGSEGMGVSSKLSNISMMNIRIPQTNLIDSFSVSAATSIICYEFYKNLDLI